MSAQRMIASTILLAAALYFTGCFNPNGPDTGGGDDGFPGGIPIERVSMGIGGTEGNSISLDTAISGDGRYVAFSSASSNLVAGDTNAHYDIFVFDRQDELMDRVSVSSDGTEADRDSRYPSISADGRYVAFASFATNLVADDTNNRQDAFVFDRQNRTVERVCLEAGAELQISADGAYVTVYSEASYLVPDDTNDTGDVFLCEWQAGSIERVSISESGDEANSYSGSPAVNADGRYVAFASNASNLIPGDTNGKVDIFVRDCQTGIVERVSVGDGGIQSNNSSEWPAISADGRYIAFCSDATNLAADDTNGYKDVFVYDRQTDSIERVSVGAGGTEANYHSYYSAISATGQFVAFYSPASNLVSEDTNYVGDIFVYNNQTDTMHLVSVAFDGTQGDDQSNDTAISGDGRYVAFFSFATNLVTGDTNNNGDIFTAPVE